MPGYDDRVTGRADAFVRDRAGGAYYRACWEGAIQSGADLVIVTSFNEWLEGTQIEPGVGHGDLYLNLTAEMAAAYRQGASETPDAALLADAPEPTEAEEPPPTALPPTETPTPLPTPSPSPSPSPTATPTLTPTPSPTSTPAYPTPDRTTPRPTSTPTLVERAAAWPGGGWALGTILALLAIGAVAQALRLRREVIRE